MRRHQCLLLGQRREGDGKIEKDRRCDPLAPAGATGLAAQCLDEAPRLQDQFQIAAIDLFRMRHQHRKFRRNHCFRYRLGDQPDCPMACIDLGKYEIAWVGGKHLALERRFAFAKRNCAIEMNSDGRPIAEALGQNYGLSSLRQNVGKPNRAMIAGPTAFVLMCDPGLQRPPRPDQAAKGRWKSGISSGFAPVPSQLWKLRHASSTPGRSFAAPSVSPVEVIPTALGLATNTG